jgi:hypothetical protein
MITSITKVLIVLALAGVAAFGADNTLGTWKLNVEKSKYTPAPFPYKNLTVVRDASGDGVNVTITGETANGAGVDYSYAAKYDGTASAVTGKGMVYDTISVKQVDANTLTDELKKTGGSYHVTGRTVVAKSGKTITLTRKGENGDGKPTLMTFVLEKQ